MELSEALLAELSVVSSQADLARCLTRLWILADRPSYRVLGQRAVSRRQALGRTTVGNVLNGKVFPRRSFLTTFLSCCGVAPDQHMEWERAWERIAPMHFTKERTAALPSPATPPDPAPGPVPASSERRDEALKAVESLQKGLGRLSMQMYSLDAEINRLKAMLGPEALAPAVAPRVLAFADLIAGEWWSGSSQTGLRTPIGLDDHGDWVDVDLSDRPPHAMIAGPSGSGKTNVMFALLAGLCARYSPRELELYLLDFKEGVSFNRFAPDVATQPWIPQARLVGININSDQEFGLALLRHLHWELKRRAAAARKFEAATISELRVRNPAGYWPRMVAVVDEFQVLLAGRNMWAAEAVELLEDIVRRGRAMGIHMVLASQDVSGIEALWGRPALVGQLTMRIALPKARRALGDGNQLADKIPPNHAVVNDDSGVAEADRVARIPLAGEIADWTGFRRRLWHMRSPEAPPPVVFDGDVIPHLETAGAFRRLTPGAPAAPVAVVGHAMDVMDRPAFVRLDRHAGRHLAIVGNRDDLARSVIRSVFLSLTRQFAEREARFTIACLDDAGRHHAMRLRQEVKRPGVDLFGLNEMPEVLQFAMQSPVPHFLLFYALDRIAEGDSPDGDLVRAGFRRLLDRGPEHRVHVIGWWRRGTRFRDSVGHRSSDETMSAAVLVGAHGSELGFRDMRLNGVASEPRRNRAQLIDRDQDRPFQTIIPYGD